MNATKKKLPDARPSELLILQRRLKELTSSLQEATQLQTEIEDRIQERSRHGQQASMSQQEQRDELIRTGKMTPFTANQGQAAGAEDLPDHRPVRTFFPSAVMAELASSDNDEHADNGNSDQEDEGTHVRKRSRVVRDKRERSKRQAVQDNGESDEYHDDNNEEEDDDLSSSSEEDARSRNAIEYRDDGDEVAYRERLHRWVRQRRLDRMQARSNRNTSAVEEDEASNESGVSSDDDDNVDPDDREPTAEEIEQEGKRKSIGNPDAVYGNGYRLPGEIYSRLFEYQRIGVKWLWELHANGTGGIHSDEMGLGKTVQMISFLAGLWYSDKWPGTVIVICPATLIKQWVQEFHRWWPVFRVVVLHSSGAGAQWLSSRRGRELRDFVERVMRKGHIVITTYEGLRVYRDVLLVQQWGYAVLDEGHKIRNPDADITLCCKQLNTPHRIILSGTPIQNNLTELWSLFDFIFPGRLGVSSLHSLDY